MKYLLEFVKLRSKTIRDVNEYKTDSGMVIWFSDIPESKDCVSPVFGNDREGQDEVWLEIRKQKIPPRPEIPAELMPWIDSSKFDEPLDDGPVLNEVAYLPVGTGTVSEGERNVPTPAGSSPFELHRLQDHPEMIKYWDEYIVKWREWVEPLRHQLAIQKVYGQLFKAYVLQSKFGEKYELVLGTGLLSWESSHQQRINRHFVVAKTEIVFDTVRGIITVRCPPPPDGAHLLLEDDFLEPTERPPREHYERARSSLEEIGDDVLGSAINSVLQSWSNSFNPNSNYSSSVKPPRNFLKAPQITFAPALILRSRTRRGSIRIYEDILHQIESGGELPIGIMRLVEPKDDYFAKEDEHTGPIASGPASRPLLPLPTNQEQMQIIEQIEHRRGVLVQGPPGTGKSHTIANLICHLLATGRRVLVTSETPRALKVLKEKIPDDFKPLCVSLLGDDRNAFSELEASISGISQKFQNWDRRACREEMTRDEAAIGAAELAVAAAASKLREIRESETKKVSVHGGKYFGTLGGIADRVAKERPRFDWLALTEEGPADPPINNTDAASAAEFLRDASEAEIRELARPLVSLQEIPSPGAFLEYVEAAKTEESLLRKSPELKNSPAYPPLKNSSTDRRRKIMIPLKAFITLDERLGHRPEPWISIAQKDILTERESVWTVLKAETEKRIGAVLDLVAQAEGTRIQSPASITKQQMLSDAKAVLEHLGKGGKWKTLGLFLSGPVRRRDYLRKAVVVNGMSASCIEGLTALVHRLTVEQVLDEIWALWAHCTKATSSTQFTQVAEIKENVEVLNIIFEQRRLIHELKALFENEGPRISCPDICSKQETRALHELLLFVDSIVSSTEVKANRAMRFQSLRNVVALHDAHPLNKDLLGAFENRNPQEWSLRYKQLEDLTSLKEQYSQRRTLFDKIRAHAKPSCDQLLRTPAEPQWRDRFSSFEQAWHWRRAEQWLRDRQAPGVFERTQEDLREAEKTKTRLLAKLASLRAWDHFLSRLTQEQTEHLQAWRHAVKKIGKGTGKTAERYRAEARKSMDGCNEAIPAWVIPKYRLADVLKLRPELFDVVIVDEASQTGIDGLFLFYLGKKIVIVGDDQQISPSGVGVEAAAITELQKTHLDGIPHLSAMDATSSIYDNAKIRFTGRVILREHFRCMPEIIEFSNALCYAPNKTPLIPLRMCTPNRLEPVVVRHVPGGRQEGPTGRIRNVQEADALVASLCECIADPRYQGKSFGVISLLGDTQAELIQNMLVSRVGPEEMEKRKIVCGNAYAFQGDERDVMFMSMVSAPSGRIGALTKDSDKQRFNVAASRAKDQAWLFHSAKMEDFSPECVRLALLKHFLNPKEEDRKVSEPVFDSDFERHVWERVTAQGFLVKTQVPAGEQAFHPYRIDLVIEGNNRRIAVECDGDRWHGPENYERDMARQRQLERAGWTFFRVRASEYYSSPESALQPLWPLLKKYAIYPKGASAPAVIETRREPQVATPPAVAGSKEAPPPLHGGDNAQVHPVVQELIKPQSREKLTMESSTPAKAEARMVSLYKITLINGDSRTFPSSKEAYRWAEEKGFYKKGGFVGQEILVPADSTSGRQPKSN